MRDNSGGQKLFSRRVWCRTSSWAIPPDGSFAESVVGLVFRVVERGDMAKAEPRPAPEPLGLGAGGNRWNAAYAYQRHRKAYALCKKVAVDAATGVVYRATDNEIVEAIKTSVESDNRFECVRRWTGSQFVFAVEEMLRLRAA